MKQGIVIKSTGSWFTVMDGEKIIPCRIKGVFRLKDIKTTNPVTVGDSVEYELANDNSGLITKIGERKNYIIRRSIRLSKEAHLLAANIDQAFLMVSLKHPETPYEFIDRFLVTAEAYHIPSVILINKVDLLDNEEFMILNELVNTYTIAGYSCIQLSVTRKDNIQNIRELLKDKITLIAGNSGVGKTSLINYLDPRLKLKTEQISDYHKAGKHTTTFTELFSLGNNTFIIDSPGIKGFGLIDFKKSEIGLFFPEIFKTSKRCKFYNCTHVHEPGCAVMEEVEEEKIGVSRYRSYLNMVTNEDSKYR